MYYRRFQVGKLHTPAIQILVVMEALLGVAAHSGHRIEYDSLLGSRLEFWHLGQAMVVPE